ncbi:MAG: hypothetical protein ABIJ47_09165 [Candidatus Bathyarchaeota archaeon]
MNKDFDKEMRNKLINVLEKKILISKLDNSLQENDLTKPVNCNGFGRIRHYRMYEHKDWVFDPLPNLPASEALNKKTEEITLAQVFQLAGCNWNCWYCFVDNELRSGTMEKSKFFSPSELISAYLQEKNKPQVIVLSGGQPDLVPEWIVWAMEALESNKLDKTTYLWSDDNLSTDYYFKYLTSEQRDKIASYDSYGKVGCFKGFDESSFTFNTQTLGKKYHKQFEIFNKLRLEGLDIYGYVTFTSPNNHSLRNKMDKFVMKLSEIHDKMPLRVVPLKIVAYSPVAKRITTEYKRSLENQHEALKVWNQILEEKYTHNERKIEIHKVKIN